MSDRIEAATECRAPREGNSWQCDGDGEMADLQELSHRMRAVTAQVARNPANSLLATMRP